MSRSTSVTPGPPFPPLVLLASRPPPIAGQSVATAMLTEYLSSIGARFFLIDIGRGLTSSGGLDSARRALTAVKWPFLLRRAGRRLERRPVVYLQLGQSKRAFLRDIPLLAMAQWMRWPVVVHVHGGAFGHAFHGALGPIRAVLGLLLSRVACAVVLTPRLSRMFDGIVAPDRVHVVSNGVELALEMDAGKNATRAARVRTILFLSNLIESKGYATVLRAARHAKLCGRPYRFVLAGALTGSGTVDPLGFIQAFKLDNVDFVGPVDLRRKCQLLRLADVFLLPTKYPVEGQPLAILEAMHYGLPVITTAAGGIPDIVRDGKNGYIVPPDDPTAVLDRLDRLAADQDLYSEISRVNLELARTRYTWRRHVEELTALLQGADR